MRRPRFDEQDAALVIFAALAAGFALFALARAVRLVDVALADLGD